MQKEVWIHAKKYEIPAVITCPGGNLAVPCVILCHGTASHKDEVGNMFADIANGLAEKGIASIRFDFAGCGDSKAKMRELTFYGEVEDTLAVYDYVCQLPQIDAKRIGILGFSQGARVMAEVLKKLPMLFCAVSWSGACHNGYGIYEKLFGYYEEEAKSCGFAVIPMSWREDLELSYQWFKEIKYSEPMEGFKTYKGPLLVMAGKKDDVVSFKHSEEIYECSRHQKRRLRIYDQADHTFCALDEMCGMKNKVLKETVEWIYEVSNHRNGDHGMSLCKNDF